MTVEQTPLSHLSIELGHIYMEDLLAVEDRLTPLFKAVAPRYAAEKARCEAALGAKRTARISTCFLIDDYPQELSSPREIVPRVRAAAEAANLPIDYLARESACARVGIDLDVARLVEERLIAEPGPGFTGSRRPHPARGWLSNGAPPEPVRQAFHPQKPQVPSEGNTKSHSVFVDVQLWNDLPDGNRLWSCSYLAAVWQVIRLGLLRDHAGKPVWAPVSLSDAALPRRWESLAPVIQLTDEPAPLAAYRTFSVLGNRFMRVNMAAQTVLAQFVPDPEVDLPTVRRAASERLDLPPQIVERVGYSFITDM